MVGHNAAIKTEPCRLLDSLFAATYRAYLTAETYLAECNNIITNGRILETRNKRKRNRKVGSRLVQLQSADNIDLNIAVAQEKSRSFLENGGKHRKPVIIKAVRHASRITVARRTDKCLNLGKNRARAFHKTSDARA